MSTAINMLAAAAAPNQNYITASGNSYTSDAYGVIKNVASGDINNLSNQGCIPLGLANQEGTFTLNGASTVTVTATSIASTDIVSFGLNALGGTQGAQPVVIGIVAGSSFQVKGTAGDTSVYNWQQRSSGA